MSKKSGKSGHGCQPHCPDHLPKSKTHPQESEDVKVKEYEMTGGQAPEDELTEILDEGLPAGHPDGQLRGDQTVGHRGGSWRQTLNRGRS